ncbi:hypothetical protein, partial [Escherichia coli]|uniref:hypothetical protein n=1 Tax=Escherichia coli TaxID=562 RepID=UPI003D35D94E
MGWCGVWFGGGVGGLWCFCGVVVLGCCGGFVGGGGFVRLCWGVAAQEFVGFVFVGGVDVGRVFF